MPRRCREKIDGRRGAIRQVVVLERSAFARLLLVTEQRRRGCAIQEQARFERLQSGPRKRPAVRSGRQLRRRRSPGATGTPSNGSEHEFLEIGSHLVRSFQPRPSAAKGRVIGRVSKETGRRRPPPGARPFERVAVRERAGEQDPGSDSRQPCRLAFSNRDPPDPADMTGASRTYPDGHDENPAPVPGAAVAGLRDAPPLGRPAVAGMARCCSARVRT